mgnify:CR=1 FL=1
MTRPRRDKPADGRDVERYLTRLGRWSARRERDDLVAEARRHLFDAAERGFRAGLPRDAAVRVAIRSFGPAWRIGMRSRALAAADAARFLLSHPRGGTAGLLRCIARFWRCGLAPLRRGRRMLERRA